jgi:hypothetical protein
VRKEIPPPREYFTRYITVSLLLVSSRHVSSQYPATVRWTANRKLAVVRIEIRCFFLRNAWNEIRGDSLAFVNSPPFLVPAPTSSPSQPTLSATPLSILHQHTLRVSVLALPRPKMDILCVYCFDVLASELEKRTPIPFPAAQLPKSNLLVGVVNGVAGDDTTVSKDAVSIDTK